VNKKEEEEKCWVQWVKYALENIDADAEDGRGDVLDQ
jgi:hypothetical protein